MIDLSPACQRAVDVLTNVTEDHLIASTPCAEYSVGDVLHHVGGLAVAFAAAARKDRGPLTGRAWTDPSAWQGMTQIAAMDMPGEAVGMVALTEVVIHGWDLAHATGQAYDVDPGIAEAVLANVAQLAAQGPVEGLFGPAVPIADDAPVLDRIIALSGRDPAWRSH